MIVFIFRILLLIGLPITIAVGTYLFLSSAFLSPLSPMDKSTRIIEIAPGMGFGQICKVLSEEEIIAHSWSLELLARFKRSDSRIQAGEYELSPSMSPKQVLSKLVSGEVLKRQVLLKEGVSIWEIGALVEAAGLVSKKEFEQAVSDPVLLAKAGIAAASFEGYLFPDTYNFSRPIKPDSIIWKMFEQSESKWKPEYTDAAEQMRMSRHEILTLASIIEKESGNTEEQPLVSSVFHNRLKQGMRLQSDPTVIYGIENFDGNLKKADLTNPHQYNTYVNFGLPPGPVCNPGESAIKAALYPAESEFLFFVSDNQGKHLFSTTLQEHNLNVLKYQKGNG